jgi:hypothetical protein
MISSPERLVAPTENLARIPEKRDAPVRRLLKIY